MRDSKIPFMLFAPANPVNRDITFLGSSSSGRMFRYEVTDEYKAELEQVGVVFSQYMPNSFYSPTRIYKAKKKGDKFTHEVSCFEEDGRKINFFKDLDKDLQKEFVQSLKDEDLLKRMGRSVNAGLSETALYKAELLQLQIRKAQMEISLLGNMNDEAMSA